MTFSHVLGVIPVSYTHLCSLEILHALLKKSISTVSIILNKHIILKKNSLKKAGASEKCSHGWSNTIDYQTQETVFNIVGMSVSPIIKLTTK